MRTCLIDFFLYFYYLFVFLREGKTIRDTLSAQLVNIIDQLGADSVDYAAALLLAASSSSSDGTANSGLTVSSLPRLLSLLEQGQRDGWSGVVSVFTEAAAESNVKPPPSIEAALKILRQNGRGASVNGKNGTLTTERLTQILRKLLREPAAQTVLATALSEVGERLAARIVRRAFRTQ